MWLWRCKFIRWGKETWKRGDEWRGGGGIVREAEAERVRACACARLSEHLVSVPAATLSARKQGGMRESLLGPCSLLMVARVRTRAHTHTLRTHAQMTRAAAAATMHKDTSLAHRLTDVALALHALD